MSIGAIDSTKRSVRALSTSTGGSTMIQYVSVLGVVALTGAVAFGEFGSDVRLALDDETQATAEWIDDAEGPVGSLAAEVATAGAEALAVQGSWALAQKAGGMGLAAARKKHRGRGSTEFRGDQRPRGGPAGGPVGGSCRNGVCSQEDGQSCFVAGTPVATPSGPKPIEWIEPGDLVLSRDEATGNFSIQRVSATFVTLDHELMDVHTVSLSGERASLRVTPGHPFWTPTDDWVPANALMPGDVLADANGAEVSVVRVVPLAERATVYNFEVEGTHTYFAGTMPVWVHNGNCFSAGDNKNRGGDENPGQPRPAPTQPAAVPSQPPPAATQPSPAPTQAPSVPTQPPPAATQPAPSPRPPNSHTKDEVADYINRAIEDENRRMRESYDAQVQTARNKGKSVDEWNAMIDERIQRVENRQGDYEDYDEQEAKEAIDNYRAKKIPPSAPQMAPITSLDHAVAKSKSCKDVSCNNFGGALLGHASGTPSSPPHVGPIQPNQLVNVRLNFSNSSNTHIYSVYYDDAGNAYVIQTFIGQEIPVVSKMSQAEYERLYARATSGENGWKKAYKDLFHVKPEDDGPPDITLTDAAPGP